MTALALAPMPEKQHHRCKDMADAKEALDFLNDMASFLETIAENPIRGRNSGTVRQAWLDCAHFYRDFYQLGGPPWMRSRRSNMSMKMALLTKKAHKQGWNLFTLD